MNPEQTRQHKLPILNWLFLLFLVSGVSAFQQTFKQTNVVESVYSQSSVAAQSALVDFFQRRHLPKLQTIRRISAIEILNDLSQKRSVSSALIIRRFMNTRHYLTCNIILHFRNRTCASQAQEEEFIS